MILLQKLDMRKKALGKLSDDHPQKEKARQVMTKDYMSSEEDEETIEVPGVRGKRRRKSVKRKVRVLQWESMELRVLKEILDDLYCRQLATDRKLNDMVPTTKSYTGPYSTRDIPKDCPTWAKTS